MHIRPRRNRKSAAIRALVAETSLSAADFIYPLFSHEGSEDQDIESMPGCKRWSL
ncbi:MAG: porphobilinogen synthase, partial [Haloferula sp.]